MQDKNQATQKQYTRRNVFSTIGKSFAAMGLMAVTGITSLKGKGNKLRVKIHPDAVQRNGREG